jgi:hypothetical protein
VLLWGHRLTLQIRHPVADSIRVVLMRKSNVLWKNLLHVKLVENTRYPVFLTYPKGAVL